MICDLSESGGRGFSHFVFNSVQNPEMGSDLARDAGNPDWTDEPHAVG